MKCDRMAGDLYIIKEVKFLKLDFFNYKAELIKIQSDLKWLDLQTLTTSFFFP